MDGKPMPDMLPWLDRNPMILHVSREGVIGSVSLWMAVLVILYLALYQWKRKAPQEGTERNA
jgi:hypothetical protein